MTPSQQMVREYHIPIVAGHEFVHRNLVKLCPTRSAESRVSHAFGWGLRCRLIVICQFRLALSVNIT
jgi:hypothetical protein